MDAKAAQYDQMVDYAAQCQGILEELLTDLVLEQPDDPHEFFTRQFKTLSRESKEIWRQRIQRVKKGQKPFVPNPLKEVPVKVGVQDTLRLTLSSPSNKDQAFSILTEMKAMAEETGKCLSFAVYYDETSLEILVLQGWQSQADLDAFTSSQSFSQLKNKWNGILSAPPANHIYHQRVL